MVCQSTHRLQKYKAQNIRENQMQTIIENYDPSIQDKWILFIIIYSLPAIG